MSNYKKTWIPLIGIKLAFPTIYHLRIDRKTEKINLDSEEYL